MCLVTIKCDGATVAIRNEAENEDPLQQDQQTAEEKPQLGMNHRRGGRRGRAAQRGKPLGFPGAIGPEGGDSLALVPWASSDSHPGLPVA